MNDPATPWHAEPVGTVFQMLDSTPDGLSARAAEARLRDYGANRIENRRGWVRLRALWRQVSDPLILVLLAAALIAMLMGKATDGAVVLAVVVLNTLVGYVQEMRAGKAIAALGGIVPQSAIVLRDGEQTPVAVHDLVPGDILLLQAGDQVGADARLIDVNGLQVEEAALTGESVPVAKQEEPVERDTMLADRLCMVHSGTLVIAGTARAVVTETGARSAIGRISSLLDTAQGVETPLTRRLGGLARAITQGVLVVAGLLFVIGLLRGSSLLDSGFAAVTLAVAAIPEGLPAVITIASAIGVRRMAQRRAIIRNLPAVETLGSTTVICTDKTGTLTRNQMTANIIWTPDGACLDATGDGYAPEGELRAEGAAIASLPETVRQLLVCAVLCNDATLEQDDDQWTVIGDPTEGALVVLARKAGLDDVALRDTCARRDEIPFDSGRPYMVTLHDGTDGQPLVCLKGAPEVVAGLCSAVADGRPLPLDRVRAEVEALASRGMRILAFATAAPPRPISEFEDDGWRDHLRFLGLVGMVDPPRREAIEAVAACRAAGITVKMVTGDHPRAAGAIGRDFGLLDADGTGPEVVTGRQIEDAGDDELAALARARNIFARVAPEHKLRLVEALQADGQVVAMTGDGVNDAPALKQAEIGVAMGIGGTAVAREAADMVLADDNFASISAAVEEGRRVYDNLVKSLAFILPTSLGQALIILVAVMVFPMAGGQLLMPIEPVQILWVNLVVATTLSLPLAFEAREPDLMMRPPRAPDEPLLGPFLLWRTLLVGGLMTASAVGLFLHDYIADLDAGIAADIARSRAQTVAVTTIILFQAIYLLNCRSLTESVFRVGLFSNPYVYAGIAATVGLQLCFIYVPLFNRLFHTYPMGPADWIAPVAVALAGFPLIAMEKRFWRGRNGQRARSGD